MQEITNYFFFAQKKTKQADIKQEPLDDEQKRGKDQIIRDFDSESSENSLSPPPIPLPLPPSVGPSEHDSVLTTPVLYQNLLLQVTEGRKFLCEHPKNQGKFNPENFTIKGQKTN